MIQATTMGMSTLYQRRLALAFKTRRGVIVPLTAPLIFALVVAPALAEALGGFSPDIDYMTYVAVAAAVLLVPLTSMFNGLSVITDAKFGITKELLAAPIPRTTIPLANALSILTLALLQAAVLFLAAAARGTEFDTSGTGVLWLLGGVALLSLVTYGLAEMLALAIGKADEYIAMIPAVAIVPWFFAGSLFSIEVLPAPLQQVAMVLPWTHALAVIRYGLVEGSDAGLADIWGLDSEPLMAGLSLLVLAVFAVVTLTGAVKVFGRKSLS